MPLTDLGGVTRTLKNLIDAGLRLQGVQPADFAISAAPPDESFNATAVISAYLYHVIESPETKNLPPTGFGSSPVPVSLSPLGLILQYIVTVVTSATSDELLNSRALLQQKYLGFIARAVHDFPSITGKTTIAVPPPLPATSPPVIIKILDTDLAATNKEIELVMRPAPKEETIAFWSSEEKHVPRLSLFLEARVALLEAPPPTVSPGIVLSVGEFVFPSSSPTLVSSRNAIWFQPPPGAGDARKIDASPGRVSLFDRGESADIAALVAQLTNPSDAAIAGVADNNRLTITASGLAPGHKILQLKRGESLITVDIDKPFAEQTDENKRWKLDSGPDFVAFSVCRDVTDVSQTPAVTAHVLPGSYTARVVLLDDRVQDRPMPRPSNDVPFTIAPQIVSVVPADPAAPATYTLTILGRYLNSSLDIFLGLGGIALRKVDTSPPGVGEFFVPAPPPPPPLSPPVDPLANDVATITFVAHTVHPSTGQPIPPPSAANPVPVQLVVNGASGSPAWITTEAT